MSSDLAKAFIARWAAATASERANSQLFLSELCDVLEVARPEPTRDGGYAFEFEVTEQHTDGSASQGRIDLYRRGCFVLESKQFQAAKAAASQLELAAQEAGVIARKKSSQPVRGTGAWDDAMVKARGQAERYVRALPPNHPNPPFLLVVDVGHSIEVFADFTQAGRAYLPFPDPRTFRIRLEHLAEEKARERLRLIWANPAALDPARQSADVTREISAHLAELAKSLEEGDPIPPSPRPSPPEEGETPTAARQPGYPPRVVADFLTRCLFCMFAEDVGLLPERSFTDLLNSVSADGAGFQELVEQLFREMNSGTGKGISLVLRKKLLQFNGGLFADFTVLPVNGLQLGLLKEAAKQNWSHVEPAIFGTLLERALNPGERHKLGAHYTPRAYVERLVLPTVVEPLRAEWESVRAAAFTHARAGNLKKARDEVNAFHDRLCRVIVLDPACGCGNFLYVSLEHLKRLEGEVLDVGAQFGESFKLELATHTVDPHQFLGLEINPRAAAITELVLWIGYLQWHFRTRGQTMPAEPVLKKFKNIECRDAVLTYDGEPEPARDEAGNPVTVWDRQSTKKDLVTGRDVPDETKQVALLTYKNPRPAEWPVADFIVGNPPFLGNKRMREHLGDGYSQTLREAYPDVPESADFVMYWWHRAAEQVRTGRAGRFGLITTNSLRQTFNRRVVQTQMVASPSLSLLFAIADHPWVDTAEGAAVRIAMTVGAVGEHTGTLLEAIEEQPQEDGSAKVVFSEKKGRISADLTTGADVGSAVELEANGRLSNQGVTPLGTGFRLSPEQAAVHLEQCPAAKEVLKPYAIGRDIVQVFEPKFIVDFFGLSADEARSRFPTLFQHVLNTVKPERDQKERDAYRAKWWIFAEPRANLRPALADLKRYIATCRTARHRIFVLLGAETVPDAKIVAIALEDGFSLGVLSSRVHVAWALATGARLGVGNDPNYNHSECFAKFPFPTCDEASRERIRKIAEELDAHRKRVQAQHPGLTLTGMYNVLEKLRGEALSRVASVEARAKEPQRRDERREESGGEGAQNDHLSVTDSQVTETGLSLRPSRLCGSPAHPSTAPLQLSEKEKQIHEAGLVSVLRQLHDDLDAAVFAAYGWPATLTDAEILERLVALNAEHAKEEASGLIRWLRPEYQNPGGAQQQQAALAVEDESGKPKKKRGGKLAWPKTLSERVKAVSVALSGVKEAVTAAAVAKGFARARVEDVGEILETLCTMGHAHRGKDGGTYLP